MAQNPTSENPGANNSTEPHHEPSKKKGELPVAEAARESQNAEPQNLASPKKAKTTSQQNLHPVQYRAVRYVSFMLEDSKHEVTPTDFIKEAVARHLAFYQTKRNIEFPNKMLAELSKLELIPSATRSEE